MGIHEDMERQREVIAARARVHAQYEKKLREQREHAVAFLAEFVREAEARGVAKTCIKLDRFKVRPDRWWQAEKTIEERINGWIVYLARNGDWMYAIGDNAKLYCPAVYSGPIVVDGNMYADVPWQAFTQVLMGHPPAVRDYTH